MTAAGAPATACRGVVCLVEVLDGRVQKGDKITAASTGGGWGSSWRRAGARAGGREGLG